jgi:hypothetical protein
MILQHIIPKHCGILGSWQYEMYNLQKSPVGVINAKSFLWKALSTILILYARNLSYVL